MQPGMQDQGQIPDEEKRRMVQDLLSKMQSGPPQTLGMSAQQGGLSQGPEQYAGNPERMGMMQQKLGALRQQGSPMHVGQDEVITRLIEAQMQRQGQGQPAPQMPSPSPSPMPSPDASPTPFKLENVPFPDIIQQIKDRKKPTLVREPGKKPLGSDLRPNRDREPRRY